MRSALPEVFNPTSEANEADTVPVHVPTNELIVGLLGVGFFAGSSFFELGLDFAAGTAGVGVAPSTIGAGSRCAVIKSNAATSEKQNVWRKIDILWRR